MLNFEVDVGATKTVVADAADAQGHPDPLPPGAPVPTWSASPAGVVSLSPAVDGLSCAVAGVAVGSTNVTVSDVLPSGRTISGSAAVTVQQGPPTQFVLSLVP